MKYIKCFHCGNKIYFNEMALTYAGRRDKYCGAECFAKNYSRSVPIDAYEADNSGLFIYEDGGDDE